MAQQYRFNFVSIQWEGQNISGTLDVLKTDTNWKLVITSGDYSLYAKVGSSLLGKIVYDPSGGSSTFGLNKPVLVYQTSHTDTNDGITIVDAEVTLSDEDGNFSEPPEPPVPPPKATNPTPTHQSTGISRILGQLGWS